MKITLLAFLLVLEPFGGAPARRPDAAPSQRIELAKRKTGGSGGSKHPHKPRKSSSQS